MYKFWNCNFTVITGAESTMYNIFSYIIVVLETSGNEEFALPSNQPTTLQNVSPVALIRCPKMNGVAGGVMGI